MNIIYEIIVVLIPISLFFIYIKVSKNTPRNKFYRSLRNYNIDTTIVIEQKKRTLIQKIIGFIFN